MGAGDSRICGLNAHSSSGSHASRPSDLGPTVAGVPVNYAEEREAALRGFEDLKAQYKELFDRYDQDEDGFIDRNEFMFLYRDLLMALGNSKVDADALTTSRYQGTPKAVAMFSAYDRDGDSRVSFDEVWSSGHTQTSLMPKTKAQLLNAAKFLENWRFLTIDKTRTGRAGTDPVAQGGANSAAHKRKKARRKKYPKTPRFRANSDDPEAMHLHFVPEESYDMGHSPRDSSFDRSYAKGTISSSNSSNSNRNPRKSQPHYAQALKGKWSDKRSHSLALIDAIPVGGFGAMSSVNEDGGGKGKKGSDGGSDNVNEVADDRSSNGGNDSSRGSSRGSSARRGKGASQDSSADASWQNEAVSSFVGPASAGGAPLGDVVGGAGMSASPAMGSSVGGPSGGSSGGSSRPAPQHADSQPRGEFDDDGAYPLPSALSTRDIGGMSASSSYEYPGVGRTPANAGMSEPSGASAAMSPKLGPVKKPHGELRKLHSSNSDERMNQSDAQSRVESDVVDFDEYFERSQQLPQSNAHSGRSRTSGSRGGRSAVGHGPSRSMYLDKEDIEDLRNM